MDLIVHFIKNVAIMRTRNARPYRCIPPKLLALGDGEVILDGGITLSPDSFTAVTDKAMLSRLSSDAKKNVVCTDLTKLGLTDDDWGKIYPTGTRSTREMYDDGVGPTNCELFVNDERMTMARYPNEEGYLNIAEVVSSGDCHESSFQVFNPDFYSMRNPQGGTFTMDKDTAQRVKSWKTTDDVWLHGYFYHDYSDTTTSIEKIDGSNLTIKYTRKYGLAKGARYCFFNVFEELDAPGEYYLDRDSGILYIYPPKAVDDSVFSLSMTTNTLININKADYLTFSGLTVCNTRADAFVINGVGNKVSECIIKNVAESAVCVSGSENLIEKNEIYHTGKGGIYLSGGDLETLTHAGNTADNNLIHDWAQIYQTYAPGVEIRGCGNAATHNEMYNSPHCAVWYDGNDHAIDYNIIHDVAKYSKDAGAIYCSGVSWTAQGCHVNYNCLYNLGTGDYDPNGIYFDDASTGQTAKGNILFNVPGRAFLLGGGRDNNVINNIIINSKTPIQYDDRAREGALNGGWFKSSTGEGGGMWQSLKASPWQSDAYRKAYPHLSLYSDDFGNPDSPEFAPNPSDSVVTGNLIVNINKSIGDIADSVYQFSTVENNAVYRLCKLDDIFVSPDSGDYSLESDSAVYKLLPDFEAIPINKIGRY